MGREPPSPGHRLRAKMPVGHRAPEIVIYVANSGRTAVDGLQPANCSAKMLQLRANYEQWYRKVAG